MSSFACDCLGWLWWPCLLSGLVFVVFGPNYAYVLLRLLYTREWSDGDATVALGCYCVYILALAVNGKWNVLSCGFIRKIQRTKYRYLKYVFSFRGDFKSNLLTVECGINFRDKWSIFTCSGDKRRAFTVQLMALHILRGLHVPQRCVHKGCSFDWSYPCKLHKYPLDINLVSKLLPLFASIGNCCDKNGPEQNSAIDISNHVIQLIRSFSQSGPIFLNTSRYGDAYHLFTYVHQEIL